MSLKIKTPILFEVFTELGLLSFSKNGLDFFIGLSSDLIYQK